MLNKYENIPTELGKKLYAFFDSIYNRFFTSEEEDQQKEQDIIEGMTSTPKTTTPSTTTPLESGPTTNQHGYQSPNISQVQQFNYAPDKLQLNPLLNQTIKRIISIDSQYRNINTYPNTTNFAFDLSEPLRDVVSLKLYSVQIPYTWYTIGKAFGSNFFYLRGNSEGITDISHNYKISISPGNYDQTTLPAALNASFNDISNNTASDVNFNGLQLVTYDPQSAKTTINLNIQNTFNESYYSLNFPYFTYPTDPTNNINSIPGYLGFNNISYNMNTFTSNKSFMATTIFNSQTSQDYILDTSNNYFTVIHYLGYDAFSEYDSRSTILNTYTISLKQNGFPYIGAATRQNIISAVNTAISSSGYFDSNSKIQSFPITDISNVNYGKTYFNMTIEFNRFKVKYVPNAKIIIIFPNESPKPNIYNETFAIWQNQPGAQYSCFYFDNTYNYLSSFISESPVINSTFTISKSTYINMTCTLPTYINNNNNFQMNIPGGTYNTLTYYLDAITSTFANQNVTPNQYFNMVNTQALLDTTNKFNLQIDLIKTFNNKNYALTIGNTSILNQNLGNYVNYYSIVSNKTEYKTTIDNSSNFIDTSFNLYDISYINISFTIQNSYQSVDGSSYNILFIQPSTQYGKSGNEQADTITATTLNNIINFNSPNDIYSKFTNGILTTDYNSQTILNSSIFTKTTNNNIDISLNLNCNFFLSEKNYEISFVDLSYNIANPNNAWYAFNIDPSYNLINNNNNGYATIIGNYPISSTVLASINIIKGMNDTFTFNTGVQNIPSDNISVTLNSGTYTTGPLFQAINTALSKNPKTYGSYFQYIVKNNQEYTYAWININRIYTTQDYILDFYDPINFVSCYAGASSVQNTTWDSTIGWILGFRDYTQYYLTVQNQTINTGNTGNSTYYLQSSSGNYTITQNIDISSGLLLRVPVTITSDTSLSTNLYNYFLISLDDFIQNHLNDGLVTITRSQTSIQLPEYSYTTTQSCDPATGQLISSSTPQTDSNNVTANQLYSINQSVVSQQNPSQQYSPGPFIKDLFGIIPVKPPSHTGDYYTEFGGSLQNQERLYFGPVNIRKMAIQLLTDRGMILDLNNSNWTFSFVCEQLYRASST